MTTITTTKTLRTSATLNVELAIDINGIEYITETSYAGERTFDTTYIQNKSVLMTMYNEYKTLASLKDVDVIAGISGTEFIGYAVTYQGKKYSVGYRRNFMTGELVRFVTERNNYFTEEVYLSEIYQAILANAEEA